MKGKASAPVKDLRDAMKSFLVNDFTVSLFFSWNKSLHEHNAPDKAYINTKSFIVEIFVFIKIVLYFYNCIAINTKTDSKKHVTRNVERKIQRTKLFLKRGQ
jgi:hypothetical protein